MKRERKRQLVMAIAHALRGERCTHEELWKLLGANWFWALYLGNYDSIQTHEDGGVLIRDAQTPL